ncbi:MAG: transglutaminase family protein [Alphaproteobacteria bacterium]|nr:transglutaminase family protein [Alphaproteobacteria bacterium]
MRIRIRHATRYRYDKPIDLAAQVVRLMPRDHEGQRVLSWRVADADGRILPMFEDGFGNRCHLVTITRRHEESAIVAEGEIETADTSGVVNGAIDPLPPSYFLRRSEATMPDTAIQALAHSHEGVSDPIERLHRLMTEVRSRVTYEIGSTSVVTSAAEVLARGRGVCQDHAHVLISAARVMGYPARYVSGYLWDGAVTAPTEASHAWAEIRIEQVGWVGFDPANGVSPTAAYVRVATGLDYSDAAPVRGIRRGEAAETLAVSVEVQQVQAQQ